MKRALLSVAVLALSGCESILTGGIPDPQQLSNAVNARFAGGPIQHVIARYGVPDSQFIASTGTRVLLWHTTNTVRLHENVTTNTSGSVGDPSAYPWLQSVPYRETSTTRVGYNQDFACAMQVGLKPDGTVEAIGFDGKMGGCMKFMP